MELESEKRKLKKWQQKIHTDFCGQGLAEVSIFGNVLGNIAETCVLCQVRNWVP